MTTYDPFTDDSEFVCVAGRDIRLGYIAHCLGIPASTLASLRAGTHVCVPREPTPEMWPSYCVANCAMAGSAWDTLSQKLYRAMVKHYAASEAPRHD